MAMQAIDWRNTRRFTVDEFRKMGRTGILAESERLELIAGEIIMMSPIGSRHAAFVKRLNRLLSHSTGEDVLLSIQDPITLDATSEPQPDIALLRFRDDYYAASHPGPDDILLLIEVSDHTVGFDRDVKASLYAEAGICEYWLFDLNAQTATVHREPQDGKYAQVSVLGRTGTVCPQALPDVVIQLDDLVF